MSAGSSPSRTNRPANSLPCNATSTDRSKPHHDLHRAGPHRPHRNRAELPQFPGPGLRRPDRRHPAWFPHSYGEELTQRVVIEPRVGGAHYEDWGDGQGHLYGHVTQWDPPRRLSLRGRVMPGSILDTTYEVTDDGDGSTLRMSKVAIGPMTEEEASGIRRFGDIANFEDGLRALVEG